MAGIGLVEQTGLMSACMKKFIRGVSRILLVAVVFLMGIV
ncbi:AbgT family transporter [Anaeromicrobium sp.]|jgi:p-aminobenzoyl-glutamate transporter AbgT|nr:AbgT family transporter [Anaeromicrobium sp.]